MGKKEKLLAKLFSNKLPRDFTKQELDTLMQLCNCEKQYGGRGSSVAYGHTPTGRVLQFDAPHPGNELYPYQVKMVKNFLIDTKEYKR
ncbi:MAG: type II toxin-antitoxin system HicA family toxin [Clostridia bacterium]|nr:type II toxin-antitoxin system HicA family toxin [Clostridia bacterium]